MLGHFCHYAEPLPTVACSDVYGDVGGDYGGPSPISSA